MYLLAPLLCLIILSSQVSAETNHTFKQIAPHLPIPRYYGDSTEVNGDLSSLIPAFDKIIDLCTEHRVMKETTFPHMCNFESYGLKMTELRLFLVGDNCNPTLGYGLAHYPWENYYATLASNADYVVYEINKLKAILVTISPAAYLDQTDKYIRTTGPDAERVRLARLGALTRMEVLHPTPSRKKRSTVTARYIEMTGKIDAITVKVKALDKFDSINMVKYGNNIKSSGHIIAEIPIKIQKIKDKENDINHQYIYTLVIIGVQALTLTYHAGGIPFKLRHIAAIPSLVKQVLRTRHYSKLMKTHARIESIDRRGNNILTSKEAFQYNASTQDYNKVDGIDNDHAFTMIAILVNPKSGHEDNMVLNKMPVDFARATGIESYVSCNIGTIHATDQAKTELFIKEEVTNVTTSLVLSDESLIKLAPVILHSSGAQERVVNFVKAKEAVNLACQAFPNLQVLAAAGKASFIINASTVGRILLGGVASVIPPPEASTSLAAVLFTKRGYVKRAMIVDQGIMEHKTMFFGFISGAATTGHPIRYDSGNTEEPAVNEYSRVVLANPDRSGFDVEPATLYMMRMEALSK